MLLMHKMTNKRDLGQYPSAGASFGQTTYPSSDYLSTTDTIDLTYEPPGMTATEATQLETPSQLAPKPSTVIPITGSIFKYLMLFGGIGIGFYIMFRNK